MICSTLGCTDPATATVLVGNTRLPKCFTHEREYADRYGCADIYALPATPVSPFTRLAKRRALPAVAISGDPRL